MISLISSVVPFIKELIFGKPADAENDPLSTKAKKWLVFLIVLASLGLNYLLGSRLYHVSVYQLKLIERVKVLPALTEQLTLERSKNLVMRNMLTSCLRDPEAMVQYDELMSDSSKVYDAERQQENIDSTH